MKKKMTVGLLILLSLAFVALSPNTSAASLLNGQSVSTVIEYPTLGNVFVTGPDVVVGPGVEIPLLGLVSIDYSDTNIRMEVQINYSTPIDGTFNGFHISDTN